MEDFFNSPFPTFHSAGIRKNQQLFCWTEPKTLSLHLVLLSCQPALETTSTARPFGSATPTAPLMWTCARCFPSPPLCLKPMVDLISEGPLCVSHVAFHMTLDKDTQRWSTALNYVWSWHAHETKWPDGVFCCVWPNSNHMCFAHCRLWIISCKDHDQVLHFMCPWQLCSYTELLVASQKRQRSNSAVLTKTTPGGWLLRPSHVHDLWIPNLKKLAGFCWASPNVAPFKQTITTVQRSEALRVPGTESWEAK